MRLISSILVLLILNIGYLQVQKRQGLYGNVKLLQKNLINGFGIFSPLNKDENLCKNVIFPRLLRHLEDSEPPYSFQNQEIKLQRLENLKGIVRNEKIITDPEIILPSDSVMVALNTTDIRKFKKTFNLNILKTYKNYLVVKAHPEDIEKFLLSSLITRISPYNSPQVEAPITSLDLSVNKINLAHHLFPEIRGAFTKVSIKELLFDTTDIDLRNRFELIGTEAQEVDQHATLIATLIAGAGTSGARAKGIAPNSIVTSSSYLDLFPDEKSIFVNNAIYVQNHSYGTVPESHYGPEAAAYDKLVYELPQLVHVFSSGNSGEETPESGKYSGVEGYSNLTGNFKLAKNVLTVGAVDKHKDLVAKSSKGPTHDGRIKPELVAYALSGTSDAAALVSGTALLLQNLFREKEGVIPSAALIKGILIAGAEDVGSVGPDFATGYGNLDAAKSMKILNSGNYVVEEVNSEQVERLPVNIPEGTEKFQLVLSWTDPAAQPGDEITLVNDLDLVLVGPKGEKWQPWVLDSSPSLEDLRKMAVRGRDSLNPVEMITLEDPEPGEYVIEVTAGEFTGNQTFSLSYHSEPEGSFFWTYPTGSDALLIGEEQLIRWDSNISMEDGIIEYRINDSEWIVLDPSASIGVERFAWEPEESGIAQLRFSKGNQKFESDVFVISPEITPQVLFNCDLEVMIGWEEVEGATSYNIHSLGEYYMEPLLVSKETTAILSKSDLPTSVLSVVPVFNDISGRRGVAVDYNDQGVSCFYKNFFAYLGEEPKVEAMLNLSTHIRIAEVHFQREDETGIKTLTRYSPPFMNLQLTYEDLAMSSGWNLYWATIILEDGSQIETEKIEIFLPGEDSFILYPNPVKSGETLYITSRGDGLDFEVFDLLGRKVIVDQLVRFNDRIEINWSGSGVFLVRAMRNGRTVGIRKLIKL